MANSNLIQSVQRCLDILIEVGHNERGITLRDLAARLNLKTPTAHNLVRTVKSKGFIQQLSGARYVLGPALFDLTSMHQESFLMAEAENAVRSLFAEMQQKATVTFSQQIGGELMTILRMSPDQPFMLQKPRQQMLNPYVSATALVLHAFGSDEDRKTAQDRYPFQEYIGSFMNNLEQFNNLVKQARKQGYAFNPVFYPDGFSVAVPVLGGRERLLGIIGLSRKGKASEEIQNSIKQEALNSILKAAKKTSELWISLTESSPAKTENKAI